MIRENVQALGMLVDVLEWDGNEQELQSFGPDAFYGVSPDGMAILGSGYPATDQPSGIGKRPLRPGDILVRPAGRTDISPLHLFQNCWWTTALRLIDG
jgi:hypothetical protein